MRLILNSLSVLLATLANWGFMFFSEKPKASQRWRGLYLKLMEVEFKKPFFMGRDIYIKSKGNLRFGSRCSFGSFTKIYNYAPINIGDDFLGAAGLMLHSGTHDPLTLEPQRKEIKIGSRVWCGLNVTILAGVTIGDDVVVGAGSVVVKDIPNGCIVGGVPAKKIGDLERKDIKIWSVFEGEAFGKR